MVALRMDWHSLISIHKPASRAVLSECLMILDHLSREIEQWTFETISQHGFYCNFKTCKVCVYLLSKGFQNHWKSENLNLIYILLLMSMIKLCTNYQMNSQNFNTSCLKTCCEWYRMLNYSRNIETFWNSLFDDKSVW